MLGELPAVAPSATSSSMAARDDVEHGQLVAGGHEVAGHGRAHDAEADEADGGLGTQSCVHLHVLWADVVDLPVDEEQLDVAAWLPLEHVPLE